MGEAIKIHKEIGSVWATIQRNFRRRVAARRPTWRAAGQARIQALAAATRTNSMRYLAPR